MSDRFSHAWDAPSFGCYNVRRSFSPFGIEEPRQTRPEANIDARDFCRHCGPCEHISRGGVRVYGLSGDSSRFSEPQSTLEEDHGPDPSLSFVRPQLIENDTSGEGGDQLDGFSDPPRLSTSVGSMPPRREDRLRATFPMQYGGYGRESFGREWNRRSSLGSTGLCSGPLRPSGFGLGCFSSLTTTYFSDLAPPITFPDQAHGSADGQSTASPVSTPPPSCDDFDPAFPSSPWYCQDTQPTTSRTIPSSVELEVPPPPPPPYRSSAPSRQPFGMCALYPVEDSWIAPEGLSLTNGSPLPLTNFLARLVCQTRGHGGIQLVQRLKLEGSTRSFVRRRVRSEPVGRMPISDFNVLSFPPSMALRSASMDDLQFVSGRSSSPNPIVVCRSNNVFTIQLLLPERKHEIEHLSVLQHIRMAAVDEPNRPSRSSLSS